MSQRGFTLIELLVALVVLGFLLVGLTGGARFGVQAVAHQAALSDTRGELDAVDRTLRRVIAETDPRAPVRGTVGTLTLLSTLQGGPADIALGVESGGRLVLRWSPHQAGKPVGPPPPMAEAALLDGIDGIALAYWGAGSWRPAWTEAAPPSLIRLRITFPDGDRRRWPDIVAAPMRQRP